MLFSLDEKQEKLGECCCPDDVSELMENNLGVFFSEILIEVEFEIFYAYFLEDLNWEKIAEKLKMTETAVKKHFKEGKKRFRKHCKENDLSPEDFPVSRQEDVWTNLKNTKFEKENQVKIKEILKTSLHKKF